MVFKMFRKTNHNIAQKMKEMTDIHRNKTELVKYLNKQTS